MKDYTELSKEDGEALKQFIENEKLEGRVDTSFAELREHLKKVRKHSTMLLRN